MIACLLWASAFPTIKYMYTLMGIGSDAGVKMLLAGIRFTLSGAMILLYYIVSKRKAPIFPTGQQWRQVFLLGLTQTALMYAFYYVGIYNTTAVKTSVLSQGSIFIVVIVAHFLYHDDRMHLWKAAGLVLGLAGILVVNIGALGDTQGLFQFRLQGEGFMLISNVFSAMSTFMVKFFGKKSNPILLNGWQIGIGGILLMAAGLLTATEPLNFSNPYSVILLVYAALISSGAFTLWYILLQSTKASELAMLRFTIPVFGAILSATLLPDESLTLNILASLVLVATGIWLCNGPRQLPDL